MLMAVPLPDTPVDIAIARTALEQAAGRLAALVASAGDPGAAVPGSDWTVAEVAAHLVLITEAYAGFALGSTEPFVDVGDVAGGSVARSSAARLDSEPERDLAALMTRLKAATSALLRATEGRASTETVVWNGRQIGVGEMLGIAVGEYLLHGRDLAKAVSQRWTIGPDDARLVLASVLPLLPLLVDRQATANIEASYDIRVRGGARFALRISHGDCSVGGAGGSVDCHVSADPVALVLVSYGRRSQWLPALTGKMVAWGRKPWLGLRLTHYLATP
jgi:uncharacterized protein (TIGR03083 family)